MFGLFTYLHTSGLLCIVTHPRKVDLMGQHPRRNQAGNGCSDHGTVFPITLEVGLAFPTHTLLPDEVLPQKSRAFWNIFYRSMGPVFWRGA